MTGPPQLRPAAGWLARRLTELASDADAALRGARHAVPPRRLRARVGAPGDREYIEGGRAAAIELEAALAPRRLDDFASVLDFGCGPGRVLAPLARTARSQRLVGVDVDAAAIAWAQAHLPGVTVAHSRAEPPLGFADGEFELIYAISVFSHLDVAGQDAWLGELARIAAPGAAVLVSTHGSSAYAAFARGAVSTAWCDRAAFADHGPLGAGEVVTVPYRRDRWSRGDLPGVAAGYGLTFHGADYITEHWSRFLEIEAIRPRAISAWQDLVVTRRRS